MISGIVDRHNSDRAQQKLEQTVTGLKDAIGKLTKPVESQKRSQRDPDALYQNGNSIGKVVGARITLNESKVFFEEIQNAGGLDTRRPFEYRDYILRFIRADSYTGMRISNEGVATNVYTNVVTEIVGRAQN